MDKILEGILVDSSGQKREQVRYTDGLIKEVGELGFKREDVDDYFDDDCLVFPGMGDVHVHAREDVTGKHCYKEDFESASKAAMNGGVTFILDMPNNPRPPVSDETYRAKGALALGKIVPIFIYAGIGPQTMPLSFSVPYKVYMGPSVGDLFFKSKKELKETLKHYRGQFVSFHCEDPEILHQCRGEKTHLDRRPTAAELVATETALELIEEFDLHGKLCHYSVGSGLAAIERAKERGVDVECEASPQHLYFCNEMLSQMTPEQKIKFQMNPPLRPRAERDALFQAFVDGRIDYLATDHAPHSQDEKRQGVSGLTGLDTYGAFVSWAIGQKGVSPSLMARVCCENPGRFVNRFLDSMGQQNPYGSGFGFIKPGLTASFTIINMKKPSVIEKKNLKTKAGWSPFEGHTFPGQVEAVFVRGNRLKNHT